MSLALAAFLLSAVSIAGTFALAYVRWPRVSVAMSKHVSVTIMAPAVILRFEVDGVPAEVEPEADPTEENEPIHSTMIRVVAINHGSEATTIADAGLMTASGAPRVSVRRHMTAGRPVGGPDVPARIEAHGVLSWDFNTKDLLEFEVHEQFNGYVHRYKRLRRLPRSRRSMFALTTTSTSEAKDH